MIDFGKKLKDALAEIKFLGRHETRPASDETLEEIIQKISDLYGEDIPVYTRLGNLIYLSGGNLMTAYPIIDFCDELAANIWGYSHNQEDKFHLWVGKQGYVFTAETKRPPKTKLISGNLPDSPIPKFDAHDIYSENQGYWNRIEFYKKKVTLFFDNPSDVSMIYFMRKIPLAKSSGEIK